MQQLNIITPLHESTKRDCIGRMTDGKVHCMQVARRFDHLFWDGARRFGYGGYNYDGRYKPVAEKLIDQYGLEPWTRVLDVGCGKGFLLWEIYCLVQNCSVQGFDISHYAIENSKEEIKPALHVHDAGHYTSYRSGYFDLAISLGTLHNLTLPGLERALQEMTRVADKQYVMVESYRNEQELFNLQCWALTAEQFLRPEEWLWLFKQVGYKGDYEFIYFT